MKQVKGLASNSKARLIFELALFACVVILAVFLFRGDDCLKNHILINPAIACADKKPVIDKKRYNLLSEKLNQYIDAQTFEGKTQKVAVYFRDLKEGPTFGINDREIFIPASLLKVPIMMTYLKLAEEDPNLLQKPLIYSGQSAELSLRQSVPDELMLEKDKPYSIDELIFRMIAYSDNHSMRVLEAYAYGLSPEQKLIEQTYIDLGLVDPEDNKPGEAFSVKAYAALFRLLYHGSYLTNEFSEKALEYLTRTEFSDGIAGGIPAGTLAAHKFGERVEGEYIQLHDCGIIYYPDNPYLLCVMSRGDDYEELKSVLRDVSRMVWEEVDSRRL